MRIERVSRRHIVALTGLMPASPLLKRYGVTARAARASLGEALRSGDVLLVGLDGENVVGLAWVIVTGALDHAAYLRLLLVGEVRQSRGAARAG